MSNVTYPKKENRKIPQEKITKRRNVPQERKYDNDRNIHQEKIKKGRNVRKFDNDRNIPQDRK